MKMMLAKEKEALINDLLPLLTIAVKNGLIFFGKEGDEEQVDMIEKSENGCNLTLSNF